MRRLHNRELGTKSRGFVWHRFILYPATAIKKVLGLAAIFTHLPGKNRGQTNSMSDLVYSDFWTLPNLCSKKLTTVVGYAFTLKMSEKP